jgi:hypothetical protein
VIVVALEPRWSRLPERLPDLPQLTRQGRNATDRALHANHQSRYVLLMPLCCPRKKITLLSRYGVLGRPLQILNPLTTISLPRFIPVSLQRARSEPFSVRSLSRALITALCLSRQRFARQDNFLHRLLCRWHPSIPNLNEPCCNHQFRPLLVCRYQRYNHDARFGQTSTR